MLYVERKKYMVKKGQVLYNSLKWEKYPLPISEYINLLNAMDSEEKDRAEFGDYAATLEDKIVHISTHSDYIIREINNLIILSNRFKGYEDLMKEYGYEEDELIAKEDVKGYIFKDHTIDKVIVDNEGMKMDVFDDVINKMNEASDDIFYSYREECDEEEDGE